MDYRELKVKVFDFIKNHKKASFLFLLIIILLIYFLASNKKSDDEDIQVPTVKPVKTDIPNVKLPTRTSTQPVYLLNRFNSLNNVIDSAWFGNKIIYATKDGVYELWQNNPIIKSNIKSVNFSSKGNFIYNNNNGYYLFNLEDRSSFKLEIEGQNLIMNDNGDLIAYFTENSLTIYEISSGSKKEIAKGDIPNLKIKWLKNSNLISLHSKREGSVELYDSNLNLINKIDNEPGDITVSMSPDQNKIVYSNNNILTIKDLKSKSQTKIEFKNSVSLNMYWIDSNKFFTIETSERGDLDIFDNYFWIINVNGVKEFISNSFAIPNKINTETSVAIDSNNKFIILNENKGKIWILSLVPSQTPIYSESGISLYKIPVTDQDDH